MHGVLPFLQGNSGQPSGRRAQLQWCFGRGRRRKERRGVQRGCSPAWRAAPSSLQGQTAAPLPGSCQRCLNLHATKSWQSLPFKSETQGLTNLVPKVMSRPAWLLLVTSIFFYLSHLLLRAFGSCRACCSASITEVTAAKKHFHFSVPWPFFSLPRLPPALCWHSHSRGSWVKLMEELLS